ncbi:MAG: hypothetical protein H7Z41_19600 [Cytophagales bacterium]|nr:hypothetical protein [Armatimonadota bacterium]
MTEPNKDLSRRDSLAVSALPPPAKRGLRHPVSRNFAAFTAAAVVCGGAAAAVQAGSNSTSRPVKAHAAAPAVTAVTAAPAATSALVVPPGATESVKLTVPVGLRTSPFNVDRYLNVPPNFSAAVYARVPGARFLAVAPNGDLLVSRPGAGKVTLVQSNPNGDPVVSDFATGLRNPHDIVFHTSGGVQYVYISESHQINRFPYTSGDTTAHDRQVIISGLPDSSSSELQGAYGHQLKNFALSADDKLYLSIASATNSSPSDTVSDPVRCAVYQFNADGTNGRLYARGLRNAEGLAMLPATNELWVVVNNRDNIGYPFHNDWDGDGADDYGRVMQSYVDNHPPEEFTRVRDGGNYGWPFANPNPDTANGFDNMPFDLDVQNNANAQYGTADSFDRITKGIQAHSAPLGLIFTQGTNFATPYREGALTALHGSWNRAIKTGYKVVYFPFDTDTQTPGPQVDFVTGFLDGSGVWGRPVDIAAAPDGGLYLSDDYSGTIYKLSYTAPTVPPPGPSVTSLTLFNADTDTPVPGFDPIPEGAEIRFADIGTQNLSIRANTGTAAVGSVVFGYDGNASYRTENVAPYAIAGDNGPADFLPWTPVVGDHTVTATPFSASAGGGTAGTAHTRSFRVVTGTASVGTGLRAEYFANRDLAAPASVTTTDATVDFDWGGGGPVGSLPTDNFSVRWAGKVEAPVTGAYTFSTSSDDGIRLWVDGQLVLDNWTDHPPTDNATAAVNLSAGQKVDIKLEFYENGGGAVARLFWSYPGQGTQIVPTRCLYPAP